MRPDKHRLSQSQKESNDFQWYKEHIDYYDRRSFDSDSFFNHDGEYNRLRIGYDLYDGKFDPKDLQYVTNPWGLENGEMPADLTHRDITSTKIRALANMASKKALAWKVVAVNDEATTRKEQAEFEMIKQTVIQAIAGDDPEQTPEEVRTYIQRKHQDPAEALANQLLEYFNFKLNIPYQTARGVKHAAISGKEVYYVGERDGEIFFEPLHMYYFDHDRHAGLTQVHKGEWAAYQWRLSPSEVVLRYGDELTAEQIDRIYKMMDGELIRDDQMRLSDIDDGYISVLHVQWKSLKKEGRLTFIDDDGVEQEARVNENYKLNPDAGDISIKWRWVPEVHEGLKIGRDIYLGMKPVNNIGDTADLSFVGTIYDYEGGDVVSPLDRMRPYQYLYNIINYRIELLMAQDKGKKVFINIGAIPRSAGIDLPTFEHYLDANSYSYLNPAEEGNKFGGEITQLVKEIDLSNSSDIGKYQQLAEWVDQKAGEVIGVPKQLEGQIREREAVQNVNSIVSLSTNVSGTFLQTHDFTVRCLLEALLNKAKSVYFGKESIKLSYVTDDITTQVLNVDTALLANSVFGVFIDDSSKLDEAKQVMQQYAFAAMQNGLLSLPYALKAIKSKTIQEAEEALLAGEQATQERAQQMEQMKAQQQQEILAMQEQMAQAAHQREMEKIKLEEALKYERELAKQTILALGFAKEGDQNNNNVPDVIDVLKQQIAAKKLELEEAKLQNEKKQQKEG